MEPIIISKEEKVELINEMLKQDVYKLLKTVDSLAESFNDMFKSLDKFASSIKDSESFGDK